MRPIKKRYVILAVALLLLMGIVAIGIGVLMFVGVPLEDGTELADGRTTVVADRWGPVKIGAYLFDLADGGYGLIDAGVDPEAAAIRAALVRKGAGTQDIRAVFFTHGHGDHTDGVRSFPNAKVYVLEPDVQMVETRGIVVTRGLTDGEHLDVFGTTVEVFALPGHTPGSAAYLVHGVLFLGDTAAGINADVMEANSFLNEDAERNRESLRNLAARLSPRRDEVRYIAFGHHGAVAGLGPLLKWAASAAAKSTVRIR
jgi:hydroxyacylglutathione hydrolase